MSGGLEVYTIANGEDGGTGSSEQDITQKASKDLSEVLPGRRRRDSMPTAG